LIRIYDSVFPRAICALLAFHPGISPPVPPAGEEQGAIFAPTVPGENLGWYSDEAARVPLQDACAIVLGNPGIFSVAVEKK
jgi:hypothetical protein